MLKSAFGMNYVDQCDSGGADQILTLMHLTFDNFCRGLHFLAVQQDEEADQCDGLWLLQDRELPSI